MKINKKALIVNIVTSCIVFLAHVSITGILIRVISSKITILGLSFLILALLYTFTAKYLYKENSDKLS